MVIPVRAVSSGKFAKPAERGNPVMVSFFPWITALSVIPGRSGWEIPSPGTGTISVIVTDSVLVFVGKKGTLPVFRICLGGCPGCGGGFGGKNNCPCRHNKNQCQKFFHFSLLKVYRFENTGFSFLFICNTIEVC